jgi:hypothetical protein
MITLGTVTFDPVFTAVTEKHQEIGGRDARVIRLTGLLDDLAAPEDLEDTLDAILEAASDATGLVDLRLRTGRYLKVRRVNFTREVHRPGAAARYVLDLEAPDPYEYAATENTTPWAVSQAGAILEVTGGGNAPAPVRFELAPDAELFHPTFSDGTRTITYDGQVDLGDTLVFDGIAGKVTLNGEDVTPYTEGELPRMDPGDTTFTYGAQWAHTASVTVTWRDRWW